METALTTRDIGSVKIEAHDTAHCWVVRDASNLRVATINIGILAQQKWAERLALAHNNHDALVKALRDTREWLMFNGQIKDDGITHPAFVKANNAVNAVLSALEPTP